MNTNTTDLAAFPDFDVRVAVREKYCPSVKDRKIGPGADLLLKRLLYWMRFSLPDWFQLPAVSFVFPVQFTKSMAVNLSVAAVHLAVMRLKSRVDSDADGMQFNLFSVLLLVVDFAEAARAVLALATGKHARSIHRPSVLHGAA